MICKCIKYFTPQNLHLEHQTEMKDIYCTANMTEQESGRDHEQSFVSSEHHQLILHPQKVDTPKIIITTS